MLTELCQPSLWLNVAALLFGLCIAPDFYLFLLLGITWDTLLKFCAGFLSPSTTARKVYGGGFLALVLLIMYRWVLKAELFLNVWQSLSQWKPYCLLIILSLCLCLSFLLNLSDIKPNPKPSNFIRFSICVPVMHYKTSFHCRESFCYPSTQCEHSVLLQTHSSVASDSSPHARWCQIPQIQANSSLL